MSEVERMLALADITLTLGVEERATLHPDGLTPESVTTHTVMLAMLAPSLAVQHYPNLCPASVAVFAIVHDLVEARIGDTNTMFATAEELEAKIEHEARAVDELCEELSEFPWLVEQLLKYEAQEAPDARFVRYVDKLLPKLTHILNGGVAFADEGHSLESVLVAQAAQRERLREEYPEFPAIDQLFGELSEHMRWSIEAEAEAARLRVDPLGALTTPSGPGMGDPTREFGRESFIRLNADARHVLTISPGLTPESIDRFVEEFKKATTGAEWKAPIFADVDQPEVGVDAGPVVREFVKRCTGRPSFQDGSLTSFLDRWDEEAALAGAAVAGADGPTQGKVMDASLDELRQGIEAFKLKVALPSLMIAPAGDGPLHAAIGRLAVKLGPEGRASLVDAIGRWCDSEGTALVADVVNVRHAHTVMQVLAALKSDPDHTLMIMGPDVRARLEAGESMTLTEMFGPPAGEH